MQNARFENIPYIRPDYKQYARNIELCAQGIRNADTMETVRRRLEEFWDYRTHVETMETLAFIRCYQNCSDIFYQEEMQITQSQGAMIDLSPIYDALLESPLRRKIDTAYGRQFLLKIELAQQRGIQCYLNVIKLPYQLLDDIRIDTSGLTFPKAEQILSIISKK